MSYVVLREPFWNQCGCLMFGHGAVSKQFCPHLSLSEAALHATIIHHNSIVTQRPVGLESLVTLLPLLGEPTPKGIWVFQIIELVSQFSNPN